MYCCLEVDLIIMKLYTALIIASIAPVSGAFDVAAAIPAFVETSTEQIVCDEQVRSTQPYYCFGSEYQNCDCWQEICGLCLPQCCFKNKGNCPRNMDNAQCNTSPVPMPSPPTPPPVNRRPGSNYCTYSPPDYACYPNTSGKPGCCWDDDGEYCPPQKPGCHQQQQPVVGSDYCTYGFDNECYPGTGKPACCLQDGGRNCPNQQPPCQQQQRLGSNYCTFGFDYSCYPQFGKPQCCFQNGGEFCPPERETCAPTSMPTNQQPPPKGKTNAPTFRPTTAGPPGQNVCTWTPDHACFPNSNGRPPCCESPQGCHVGSSTECEPRGKKNLRFKAMKGSEN